jgi:hypothetical protein
MFLNPRITVPSLAMPIGSKQKAHLMVRTSKRYTRGSSLAPTLIIHVSVLA